MDKRSKDKWKHVVNSKMKKWRSDAKTLSINLKKKKKKKLGLEQIEHFQTKLSGQAVLIFKTRQNNQTSTKLWNQWI